jgi:transposase
MTLLPRGLKVHLALGYTDMRKGIDGLAMLVQAVLRQDPFSGHLFVFRGRKANLIKIVYWDGTGLCLFTKRLEQGVFLWPPDVDPGETLALSSEQISMLIDGVDGARLSGGGDLLSLAERSQQPVWLRLIDSR